MLRSARLFSSFACPALFATAWMACCVTAHAQDIPRKADLIITNAKVWTGNPTGPKPPEPAAIAIIGDSIVEVGVPFEVTRDRLGPKTKMLDAQGRQIIPGITDSHTHIIGGGMQLVRLNLRDAKNRDEFVRAVETAAKGRKDGEWVLGGLWSVDSWSDAAPPRASWIDPVTGSKPTLLTRMDGHQALANSAALKLAGIDAQGPADPTGGEIERDPKTKEPTGILKESAMDLVEKHIPAMTPQERKESLFRAMRHANSLGVTSVHDMSAAADLETFVEADKAGQLTVRISSFLTVDSSAAPGDTGPLSSHTLHDKVHDAAARINSKWLQVAGLKAYMDGSLGSRTAYMKEPFADADPGSPYPKGQLTAFASSPGFVDALAELDECNFQWAIHAIGDQANHLLLDAYEAAASKNNSKNRWHRIEHAQHLLVDDIPRFSKLFVVASMQPLHKADDARYAEKALGSDRLAGSYAFRELLNHRSLLVFGSDWPVVSMNPFEGIASAVTGKTLDGKVWLADHSITVAEAISAYTAWPPRAVRKEVFVGTLEPGKFADLVILKDDPFSVPAEKLATVRVGQTIVGGKVVYTAPE